MELSRPLLRAVTALNFEAPSLVQQRAIPIALAGRDLCVCAQTGSGKTAAFMLPVLERLMFRPKKVAQTRVMVLSPTRELAVQVCIAPSHGTCTRIMLDEHTRALMLHSLTIHSFTYMQHSLMPHPLTYHTHSCHTLTRSCHNLSRCNHSLASYPLTQHTRARTIHAHCAIIQVYDMSKKLAQFTDISFGLAVGGMGLRPQEAELRARPDVIVATPGRLVDHITNTFSFSLDGVEIVVMDEADRWVLHSRHGYH
jgi:hypothetical protein